MDKSAVLKANGTYNKRYRDVKKPEFLDGGFYDPMDIVQVKYEMLRDAEDSERAIASVAGDFGFSRTAYYNIRESFEANGMVSFIPEKTGPRQPNKLKGLLLEFIEEYIDTNPKAGISEIVAALHKEKGETVSRRTIERYKAKKKQI